jgi:nicotinate phosphoribosyltransferase
MSASRAAFIGGAAGTSNTAAGKAFGIPVMGTMAHSWVMSFAGEEEAFSAYADIYPKHPVFLIDTYDTLKSGAPNAITVGKRLAAGGKNFGIRLDSGDIHYLSVEVRKMLDAAGLSKATISVSNDLDESIIQTLTDAGAPVNSWGVGTQMVTGGGDAAFTGVYKLIAKEDSSGRLCPAIKFSDNPEKTTTPGIKQVWRLRDSQGMALADVLDLEETCGGFAADRIEPGRRYAFWHPSADYRHFYHTPVSGPEPLLKLCLKDGTSARKEPSLEDIRRLVKEDLDTFDQSYKRLLNPHIYKVSITEAIRDLKLELIKNFLGDL